jgi:hypothetical protein
MLASITGYAFNYSANEAIFILTHMADITIPILKKKLQIRWLILLPSPGKKHAETSTI